jgi:hypothetical protein
MLEFEIFLLTVVWGFLPTTNIGPCGRTTDVREYNGVAPLFTLSLSLFSMQELAQT